MKPTYTVRPTSVGLLARGRDYNVRDLGESTQGYTNLLKRELGVSLNAEAPQTRFTQLHELAHVKHSLWSPERIVESVEKRTGRKLSVGSVLAAEDARINELMLRAVPDAHRGFKLAHKASLRRDIDGWVASHASPACVAEEIGKSLDPAQVEAMRPLLRKLAGTPSRELSVLRVTVPLAIALEDVKAGKREREDGEKGKGEDKAQDERGEPGEGKPSESGDDASEPDSADGRPSDDEPEGESSDDEPRGEPDAAEPEEDGDDMPADAPGEPEEEDREAFGKPDAHKACGSPVGKDATERIEWVIPDVLEPALTRVQQRGNYCATSAETGVTLRWHHLYRIQTDGRVFRKARRKPGALQRGTVLIDASSSMHFTDEQLDQLIDMLPFGTVAIYSGVYCANAAWVVVVARGGRRVACLADVKRGGGNMCDGPALLWLSRQPGPRLWVCDGAVTGTRDRPDERLRAECVAIMQAAGIVQVCGAGSYTVATRTHMTRMTAFRAEDFGRVLRDVERGRVGG